MTTKTWNKIIEKIKSAMNDHNSAGCTIYGRKIYDINPSEDGDIICARSLDNHKFEYYTRLDFESYLDALDAIEINISFRKWYRRTGIIAIG